MLRGSSIVTVAEIINNGCIFARNLILARILSRADFGIAATLGLVVALFELGSKLSFGQQIIQSPEGDSPDFEQTAHACQVLAGIVSAGLIVIFAYPLSVWFGMPKHWTVFLLLAFIPLSIGFSNLDVNRLVRHLRFGPLVLADTVPQVAITLAAWPLAAWLGDYRAILGLLLAKASFSMIVTHLAAERRYRLCWDPKLVYESLRFGWPLLMSSFVMFGIVQGDQMLIAGAYPVAELGMYAAAATLAMAPATAIFKITATTALSVLASAQTESARFRRYYSTFAQGLALFGSVFAVTMILAGQAVITLLFGQKYREAGALAAWLTVSQAIRILRGAPTCAALAKGDSVNTLLGNVCRLAGLALAALAILLKADLRLVAAAGGIGETIALSISITRLQSKHGIPMRDCFRPVALLITLVLVAFLAKNWLATNQVSSALAVAILGDLMALVAFCAGFVDLRRAMLSVLSECLMKLRVLSKSARSGEIASA